MAITKDEFDRLNDRDDDRAVYEQGTNAHTILQFLATHSEQAFPPKEIADETGIPPGSVRGTLSRLAETNLVEHAEKYWSINESELATRRAALVSQQAIDSDRYSGYDREAEAGNAEYPISDDELHDRLETIQQHVDDEAVAETVETVREEIASKIAGQGEASVDHEQKQE